MSMTFPRARRSRKGYDMDEVEDFLEDARRAYSNIEGPHPGLTSDDIRRVAFSMRSGGYSAVHVDAALERLEDAFAQREREQRVHVIGEQAWYGEVRETAQAILDRAVRPRAHRFRRVSILTDGYSTRDVDAFCDRLSRYFQQGEELSIEQVRTVSFRPQRAGYDEAQVDYLLETVTRVMLAVR